MKRLLIYEHLTGGGMAGEELQASWLDEGQAMRRAAIAAFRQAGCDVVTLQDARLPAEDHTEFLPINHKADLRPAFLQMIDQTDHGLLVRERCAKGHFLPRAQVALEQFEDQRRFRGDFFGSRPGGDL